MEQNPPRAIETPALQTIVNAVENASDVPVTAAAVGAILRSGVGHPSHVRAIFGDVTLRSLDRFGAAAGISTATILNSYRIAKQTGAAANPELDRALAEPW